MKNVTMIRVTIRPHAICVSDVDGHPCPFERQAGALFTAAEVRNEAQRHVQRTGHTVLVDVLDRTEYAPMPGVPAEVTP